MIPETGWLDIAIDDSVTEEANYGLTKPLYLTANQHKMELGPLIFNTSGGSIKSAWWLFEYISGIVYASRHNSSTNSFEERREVLAVPSLVKLSATFDQLGRPLIFFDTGTELRLYWFDPELAENIVTTFGVGEFPFATFDIRWDTSNPRSDVILLYTRNGGVYYRLQRDRYQTEYVTPVTSGAVELLQANMTVDYRLQLVCAT